MTNNGTMWIDYHAIGPMKCITVKMFVIIYNFAMGAPEACFGV
jgi:hypothetical protein